MIGDQGARRFGFTPDIDQRPWPVETPGPQGIVPDVEMFALVGQPLALHQARHHGDPLAAVGIAGVMLRKADACLVELGPVPGIDQIDRKTAAADVLDPERKLREHDRMIEIGLDRGDDLDPAGQRGQCGRRAPGLELIEILLMRIDRVLRNQRGVVAQRLCREQEIAVALP